MTEYRESEASRAATSGAPIKKSGWQLLADLAPVVGQIVGYLIVLIVLGALGVCIWAAVTAPPEQQAAWQAAKRESDRAEQQEKELKLALCREAAACKKYGEARLECATAGNFRTCLRIKMGNDTHYIAMCSGYDEGAPAVLLPPETPNAVNCFFQLLLLKPRH